MIKADREAHILSMLAKTGFVSIRDLSARIKDVSSITLRRDVAELARRGLLRRTHGGAASVARGTAIPAAPSPPEEIDRDIGDVDAMILSPIEGGGAETLRSLVRRKHLPFLAESTPQAGGVYLGPDNFAAGRELGTVAAHMLRGKIAEARVLLISLESLPNTRARCDGFLAGFSEEFGARVTHWRVDGQGSFRSSLRASLDAFQAHPQINVVFGVNDHSILAAIEASDRLGLDGVFGFSVGGEGTPLFDALVEHGKLMACSALFPEVVGERGIDVLASALSGAALPDEVETPYAVLTPANMADYYRRDGNGWSLVTGAAVNGRRNGHAPAGQRTVPAKRFSIGFLPHYPAHDWYRNMARAMQRRADELGLELRVGAPGAGIAREIHTMRALIARAAAAKVAPGDTILVNAGAVSLILAEELKSARDITVVTNSLEVMQLLAEVPELKVILTSGEYQAKHSCLVGPSLGALFETLKVDKAFLAVDGVSARFGASAADERLALAARRFVHASRQVFVLADHSLVGNDANHRIVPIDAVDEVITDSGSLPADRLALASAGTRVSLADEQDGEDETWLDRRPGDRVLRVSRAAL
jgi:DeoR/GlpR family transcriptional regulator of sugar metabolism